MISEQEIKHIAKLARILLDTGTEKKLQKELASILEYVNQLNSVNTEDVEPLYQTTGLVNQMRFDEPPKGGRVYSGIDEKMNELLIGQTPHKENRFVKVKSVLKK